MRVFPHRDWPLDSGPRPRRRSSRARLSIEGLESRSLLTVSGILPDLTDLAVLGVKAGVADLAVPDAPPPLRSIATDSSDSLSQPPAETPIADPATNADPPHWVIDAVQWQAFKMSAPLSSSATATVAEIESIHDTMQNAQVLPQADDLQVQGMTGADSPADMYRVPIDVRMGSITVSLANPGALAHFVKHIQLMDDSGYLYGDLQLDDPLATLSISLHPRIPRSEETLYLGIFSTPSSSPGSSPDGGSADPYSLSVIQQPASPENVQPAAVTQSTAAGESVVYASLSNGSELSSLNEDLPSAANQAPTLPTSTQSDSLELGPVVVQTGTTLSLPERVIAPEGGILSMGDGTEVFVPSGLAVDLALIELDATLEECPDAEAPPPGELDREWAIDLSRPTGGLPLAMVPLEEYRPDPKLDSVELLPVVAMLPKGDPSSTRDRKSRRWRLLQTGVGIASAVAFALLMPDAALMLHDRRFRPRRKGPRPTPDEANPS